MYCWRMSAVAMTALLILNLPIIGAIGYAISLLFRGVSRGVTAPAPARVPLQFIVIDGTTPEDVARLLPRSTPMHLIACANRTRTICGDIDSAEAEAVLRAVKSKSLLPSVISVAIHHGMAKEFVVQSTQAWESRPKVLSECLKGIGRVLFPGSSPEYDMAKLSHNHRVVVDPAVIVYAETQYDVIQGVECARAASLKISVRAGGHSYEAYGVQTGAVAIDISAMSSILAIDGQFGHVNASAGTTLGSLYLALSEHGRTIPGGSCPSVGLGGHALGGGFGLRSRKYGLVIDMVESIDLVDVNGIPMTVDANHAPDLFWALRGAGQGQFGIVTSFRLKTVPADPVVYFEFSYNSSRAARVVAFVQAAVTSMPDELFMIVTLVRSQATVGVAGQFIGLQDTLTVVLNRLEMAEACGTPVASSITSLPTFIDSILKEANMPVGDPSALHAPAQSEPARAKWKTRSGFVNDDLSPTAIAAIVAAFYDPSFPEFAHWSAFLQIDTWGGAVARVSDADTAFAHRSAKLSVQLGAYWPENDTIEVAIRQWQSGVYRALLPGVTGAYLNYPDADLPDFMESYYAQHTARLIDVKTRYDPTNVMQFRQSIPVDSTKGHL